MDQKPAVLDETLCQLMADVVKRGLEVEKSLEEKKYRSRHRDFPTMSVNENGLPKFSSIWSDNAPIDYSRALDDAKINTKEEDIYHRLTEYAKTNERLNSFFINNEESSDYFFFLHRLAERILDRYIHEQDNLIFDKDKFISLYLPIENYLYSPRLPVATLVPILYVKFNFESFPLTSETSIEQMGETTQLSRMQNLIKTYSHPSVNPDVAGSATHAFLHIYDWTIPNDNFLSVGNINAATPDVLLPVDYFFAALRIIGIETGYAQVCSFPIGWEARYTEKLSSIISTSIRNYPPTFEDWRWRKETEFPLITKNKMQEIREIFRKLSELNNKSVDIAVRRLNRCLLREEEEDAILDATIALETLLVEDSREITHKLATRVAALWKFTEPDTDQYEIFSAVKNIYGFRSAIVHGSGKAKKYREIDFLGNKTTAVDAAIECLRMALKTLIQHPKYLKPQNIDKELLLGSKSSGK